MIGESLFDAFEGYQEDWPGVYREKKEKVNVITTLINRAKWSPDFKKVKLQKNHLLFVADELCFGGAQYKYISDAKYLGKAVSLHDSYALRGTKFAILIDGVTSKAEKAKIKGEVYAISPETLLVLDRLKFNTVMCNRSMRTFFLKDQNYPTKNGKRVPSVKCWVYLAKKDTWHDGEHMPLFPRYNYAGMKDRTYYEYFPRASMFTQRPHHAPYPMVQGYDHWHEHVG